MEQKYSISIYPGTGSVDGKSGDHVLLCPAYIVGPSDVETIVDRAATVIKDFFDELKLGAMRDSLH
jgi:adenosylmethionine-8-amino-7-oxononanoate aminotransferase